VYLFPSVNVENRTDAIWVLIAEVMVAEAGESLAGGSQTLEASLVKMMRRQPFHF